MKRFWIAALLAAQTCGAATNQIEFGLGHGSPESSIQANGSAESIGDRGTAWWADWLHQAGPQVYWGIGGGQFRSDDHTSSTFVPASNTISTLSSRSTSILLLSRVDIAPPAKPASKWVPYVMAGSGWTRTSIAASTASATLIDQSHSTLGYMVGAGIDWLLTDRLYIGADARYQGALQRNYDLTPEGQALTGVGNVQSTVRVLTFSVKAGIKY